MAAFRWSSYLILAAELGDRSDEAALRTAISRAYYYVYHIASARARRNGFVPIRGESTHNQLWRLFSKSPEPGCWPLAQIALRMKEKRERADYNDSFPRLADEVPAILGDAHKFMFLLDTLAPRHPNPASVRQ